MKLKMVGGSHVAAFSPTINGARDEPTLEKVEKAPMAMFRATVGNISVVKTYLKIQEFYEFAYSLCYATLMSGNFSITF